MGKTPVLVGSHDGQLQGIPHPWASGIYTMATRFAKLCRPDAPARTRLARKFAH